MYNVKKQILLFLLFLLALEATQESNCGVLCKQYGV